MGSKYLTFSNSKKINGTTKVDALIISYKTYSKLINSWIADIKLKDTRKNLFQSSKVLKRKYEMKIESYKLFPILWTSEMKRCKMKRESYKSYSNPLSSWSEKMYNEKRIIRTHSNPLALEVKRYKMKRVSCKTYSNPLSSWNEKMYNEKRIIQNLF